MKTLELLSIEIMKNRRRRNILFIIGILLVEILFISVSQVRSNFEEKTWLIMFFDMPVVNAVFLPVLAAVLASRHIDIESRGDVWKQLYTFDSPLSFFKVKLAYGILSILLLCTIQLMLMIVSGSLQGYEGLKVSWILAYFGNTFLVTFNLYLLQLILSFAFKNQVVGLSVGILSGMAGLFVMFLPPVAMNALPMGGYGYTAFAGMDWDIDTRITTLYEDWPSMTDYIPAFAWFAVLLIASSVLFTKKDSDGVGLRLPLKHLTKRSVRVSDGTFSRLFPEVIKVKNSMLWIPFIGLPLISAAIGTFNFWQNKDILDNEWYSMWSQHTLFLCYFFYPATIALACSHLCRMEHKGTNWNQLLVCASPLRIVLEKVAVSTMFSFIGVVWISILFFASGKIVGFTGLPPVRLLGWLTCGMAASVVVSSLHLIISLIIRNFALPIAISISGGVLGLMFTQMKIPYYFPYSLFCVGMRANNPEMALDVAKFIPACMAFTAVFTLVSIAYIRHTDVRTNQ